MFYTLNEEIFMDNIFEPILDKDEKVTFYEVEVEAQESIHNHNAWAWQSESK